MVSLDFRSRTDDDIVPVDTCEFFGTQLPDLLDAHHDLAAPGAGELGVDPFTFRTPHGSWTMQLDDGRLALQEGDGGAGEVRLSDADVADVVNDLKTPMTFLTAGNLDMAKGNLGDFLDWWVVLRALIDGRRAHTRGAVEFRDRN